MSAKASRGDERVMCIKSLEAYVGEVKRICEGKNHSLFRGQIERPGGEKLVPSFYRKTAAGAEVIISKQGLQTEQEMLDDFKRRAQPFLTREPKSDIEWLALAQHYGMPTRLLDWTSSAFAALWFVVVDEKSQGDGVVWVLNFDDLEVIEQGEAFKTEPFKITELRLYCPAHFEPRFRAQGGWFTIHPNGASLDNDPKFKGKLETITVCRGNFREIRKDLNLCGMNEVTIYPDLSGLAKHIAWRNSRDF